MGVTVPDGSARQTLLGIRILLADDYEDNQFLIRLVLENAGAEVTTVDNGTEAVRAAHAQEFDLVLMDIQMPEKDGYEATRELRASGFLKPIIALTAHAMPEERARTFAAGCNGHVTKPIDQNELIKTIRQFTRPATNE